MSRYRFSLPQSDGSLFLTDAGIETDLIFNHGIEIREFAAHTLLADPQGREAVANYFRGFLSLARDFHTGFILDSQTWKAHLHWADDLGTTAEELEAVNKANIAFLIGLRSEFRANRGPIVINGVIGPRGDGYTLEQQLSADDAERYHANQMSWLAETDVDMVTALTFTQATEAIGVVRAAKKHSLPVVVSFTVEIDGCLPSGQPLKDAINMVDEETGNASAYFMINCAHPDHFFHVLEEADWAHRIRGLRCNASRLSHAELDESEVLDDGNIAELADQYGELARRMPWVNVFGGCCGSDLRHVAAIAKMLADKPV